MQGAAPMQSPRSNISQAITVKCSEDYVPRAGFVRRIRSAFNWIEPADLEGIDFVFIFENVPPTTPGKNRDLEKAIREGLLLFAAYNSRSAHWPAHIVLIARNLYERVPRLIRHSPAMTLWIAENIAHEVGHHLIAERRFSLRTGVEGKGTEDEEEFAERYAKSIVARMKSGTVYKFGEFLLKIAAEINYYKGARKWKKGEYELAADYFYMAIQLYRDHPEAGYWFWQAKAKVSDRTPDTQRPCQTNV